MTDARKTKAQRIAELEALRARLANPETAATLAQERAALQQAIEALEEKVAEHRRAQESLRRSAHEREELEERVIERTTELAQANAELRHEIAERRQAETALRESEARSRAILEAVPDLMFRLLRDGRLLDYRAPSHNAFHFPHESLLGMPAQDVLPRGFATLCLSAFDAVHREGGVHPLEYRLESCEGACDFEIRLVASGPEEVLGIVRDITVRKRMEEALRASEERFRTLVDHVSEWVWQIDERGRFAYVSPRVRNVIGYDVSEVLGRSPMDFMDPASRETAIRPFRRAMANRLPFGRIEGMLIHKDGHRVTCEVSGAPYTDEQGIIRGYRGLAHDVTERKRTEEALRESEALYRTLAENLPGIVYRVHLRDNKRIEFFNDMMFTLSGYTEEELPTADAVDRLIFPEDLEYVLMRVEEAVEHDHAFEIEYRVRHKDGHPIHIFERGKPRRGPDGEPLYVDGIVFDITERKRAERAMLQSSRMEATATLAGGIAHDFNNLMVGVLGNADLLQLDLADNPQAMEMLRDISQAAQRAGDLAQQMLAYARGGKYRPGLLHLNELSVNILQLQERSTPKLIRFEHDFETTLYPVWADETQLTQVVVNLCSNAVEAIEGEGAVSIVTRNVEVDEAFARDHPGLRPGPHTCLTVRDTGCGMAPEVLARVFEPFFTTKFLGRGLGLAAVYGIVKNHHGHIVAQSQPGAGAQFAIYLPAAEPEPNIGAGKKDNLPRGAETILVIDDEKMVLDVVQRFLSHLGYRVLRALDGREAMHVVREYRGDITLAILDMDMPGLAGQELYSLLTRVRPNLRVILCSGYNPDTAAHTLLSRGASLFLPKPFGMEVLATEVRKVLDA